MDLIEFAKGIGGLLSALGSLLLGIAALITAVKGKGKKEERKMVKSRTWILLCGLVLILVSATIFVARATQPSLPLNAELTNTAWEAFNKGNYEEAISASLKCINEFKGSADRQQNELESSNAPLPPKGSVSEETRTEGSRAPRAAREDLRRNSKCRLGCGNTELRISLTP